MAVKNNKKKQADKVEGKVFVGLNRANGLVFAMPDGRKVRINGNASDLRAQESGKLPVGAFGLTMVNAEDWAYIKKTYGKMEIFKNGLIIAQDSRASAQDEAEEKEETRHGLEPVDPKQPNTAPNEPEAAA